MTKATDEKKARAKALRESGMTYQQVADELGITPGTAFYWVNGGYGQRRRTKEGGERNANKHLCKSCKWRNRSADYGCNYFSHHENSRSSICTIKDCTVYEEGPIVKEKKQIQFAGRMAA